MIKILNTVTVLIILVNIFGIAGLTTYWVNQRIKQIGVRRALGATRLNISRYFLIENGVLCSVAIIIGAFIALIVNDAMIKNYSSSVLPLSYVIYVGLLLMGLTIASASFPAWRASKVSPAEATS